MHQRVVEVYLGAKMLKITGLNQYYGGSHILRDLEFKTSMGACTTLLGRNGVGKTTLLKCLFGLVLTSGTSCGLPLPRIRAIPDWLTTDGLCLARPALHDFQIDK